MSATIQRRADPSELANRAVRILRCPQCQSNLTPEGAALRCTSCDAVFTVDDGVIRLCEADEFYEGAYEATMNFLPRNNLLSLAPLYLHNVHYLWNVRRYVPEGASLLELGCGGGIKFFADRTDAAGLDLSFSSVRRLDSSYALALQGDALDMPVKDTQFDAVVSAFFYEHIAPDLKPLLLAEMFRVLKPGGRAVMLFDVESHNPLFRYFRRNPERYQECFVEHDHHYGLEPASVAMRRFGEAGFRVRHRHLANKTPLQHLPVYGWAEPYGGPLFKALASARDKIAARRLLSFAYTYGVTIFDDLVEPWFPMDWARLMLVVLEKPA